MGRCRDDLTHLQKAAFSLQPWKKKGCTQLEIGLGVLDWHMEGCTSFSETTVMSAQRKSILVCFPFGSMRIPAVNTREWQKKWEKTINLGL